MPSRVLRHGLVDSETVACLHDRTFRLWIHLLMAADDFGLVEIGFGPIRRACPMLDWSREIISKMLVELTDAGLLIPYEVEGKSYAAIPKWESRINCESPKHPIPSFGMHHVRAVKGFKDTRVRNSASKFLNHINDVTVNSVSPVDPAYTTSGHKGYGVRGKGKGGTTPKDTDVVGKESSAKPARGARLPHETLPAEWREWACANRPDLHPEQTFDAFRDYWRGVPGAKGTKLDWAGTWRTWCRKERSGSNGATKPKQSATMRAIGVLDAMMAHPEGQPHHPDHPPPQERLINDLPDFPNFDAPAKP